MNFVEFAGEIINKQYIASINKIDANFPGLNSKVLYYLKAIILINNKTLSLEMSFIDEKSREEKIREIVQDNNTSSFSYGSSDEKDKSYIGVYL